MRRCSSSNDVDTKKKLKSYTSINGIPDDILHEILIRLPNLRSALRLRTICKAWFCTVYRPDFVANFMNLIRQSNPPLRLFLGTLNQSIRINLISSSLSITGPADSFPWLFRYPNATIKAMCDDLMLVHQSGLYYVCNPLTGQIYLLGYPPKISREESVYVARCGLVSKPNKYNTMKYNICKSYTVMLVCHRRDNGGVFFLVYLSDPGRWTMIKKNPLFMSLSHDDVVASNAGLYWVDFKWVFALSYFGSQRRRCVAVRLPHALFTMDKDVYLNAHILQLKLGLFGGQPRLSQLLRVDSDHLSLKVWDLKYDVFNDNHYYNTKLRSYANDDNFWHLLHDVVIEAADNDNVFVVAFHPSLSDQIFMLHNHHLYQYDINTNKRIMVAEIHYNSNAYNNGGTMPRFQVYPFSLPVRPTLII